MSKRPNFANLGNQSINGFSSQSNFEPRIASKPFDGFKTTSLGPKKPFEFKGVKNGNATDYNGGIGIGAIEKGIVKELNDLDWELDNQPKISQVETKAKPKLFFKKDEVKKNGFNDTGETKATAGLADWDLPSNNRGVAPKLKGTLPSRLNPTSDWDLPDSHIKPVEIHRPSKGYYYIITVRT